MFEENENYIAHYGTPRHSGRYPYGSGDNPYQHEGAFLRFYREQHALGKTDKEIADMRGMSITELKAKRSVDSAGERAYLIAETKKLKAKGMSNVAIAERLQTTEGTIRNYLKEDAKEKANRNIEVANMLKRQVDEKGCIDVGTGVEKNLNITKTQLDTAVSILKQEGYEVGKLYVDQITNRNQKTTVAYVAKKGTTAKELYSDLEKVKSITEYSTDGGSTFQQIERPSSVNSNRIQIRYAEEGGLEKDGTIELRRGVEDISLGNSLYAQVRIAVDGSHYMKGMAVYSDNMPDGVDIIFNTNKKNGTPKEKVFKELKKKGDSNEVDWDNPFGALIKQEGGQRFFKDNKGNYVIEDGKYVLKEHAKESTAGKELYSLSPVNKLKSEGDWNEYAKTLSSQFLSKQSQQLIKQQLNLKYKQAEDEFNEYMNLTNPVLKKKLLLAFGEQCDSSAVDLKAAALPRQTTKVLLPSTTLKDNEIYAPSLKDGEHVVLIRYPHAGTFEIPELIVNNRNKECIKVIGKQSTDAAMINSKVAEQLSGADFDGDTAMVIPVNNKVRIQTSKRLKDLEGFDPKDAYPGYEGMRKMTPQEKGKQMGIVSNLITDMTLQGAPEEHLVRAVKHSMVVIDAEKHGLNYRQSEIDNNIKELKNIYQNGGGASTLISRAKSETRIPEIKKAKWTPDPETGEWIYKKTGRTYNKYDQKGNIIKTVEAQTKAPAMYLAKDARELSSGHPKEELYAEHANKLKALANLARKEAVNIDTGRANKEAKGVYANEIATLNAKLDNALRNAPRERQAQLIANHIVKLKVEENPDLKDDKEHLSRLKNQELTRARNRIGASKKDVMINITEREWEAIQNGAISPSKLEQIFNNTDQDRLKKLATPNKEIMVTPSKQALINNMIERGYTLSEVADQTGLSVSTISKYSKS